MSVPISTYASYGAAFGLAVSTIVTGNMYSDPIFRSQLGRDHRFHFFTVPITALQIIVPAVTSCTLCGVAIGVACKSTIFTTQIARQILGME